LHGGLSISPLRHELRLVLLSLHVGCLAHFIKLDGQLVDYDGLSRHQLFFLLQPRHLTLQQGHELCVEVH